MPGSKELCAEINEIKVNGTDAKILFKNSSYIKVVTASDSSRGNRANVLLLDEFRILKKDVVDTVLRKFLTQRRMPRYSELTETQRQAEYAKEKNITMYLSSAWWKDSWSFTKCKDTCSMMLDDTKHQFVCGLPYELSIQEGLLDRELVEDEMSETEFSEVKHLMEYCAEFYGSDNDSFFDFESISKNRKLKYAMMPDSLSSLVSSPNIRIMPKVGGEIRLLSADIALMSSKKNNNDATAIFINSMMPTKSGRYMCNIVYGDVYEGLHTADQALIIRKMFDEYSCDYIVLDCMGVGLGVADALMRDVLDPETGQIYPALTCCNDKTMADRCSSPNAEKAIWSIKANPQMNSDCAFLVREGFRSGKIRLLVSEYDVDELFGEVKGYNSLPLSDKIKLQMPYINTTLLVDEMIKLQHEESNNKIRIYEKRGARKDRYSSLAYNYYVATQLEARASKRRDNTLSADDFVIKAPNYKGKVGDVSGRGKQSSWIY